MAWITRQEQLLLLRLLNIECAGFSAYYVLYELHQAGTRLSCPAGAVTAAARKEAYATAYFRPAF